MWITETFWTNPQYRVTVVDGDEGDDDNNGTLIVALLQKERRLKKKEGAELLTMGYAIYKVSSVATEGVLNNVEGWELHPQRNAVKRLNDTPRS